MLFPAFFPSGFGAVLSLIGLVVGFEPGGRDAAPLAGAPVVVAVEWAARADSAQAALTQHFWLPAEHYYRQNSAGDAKYNYWWQAHGLDALLDGYQRTKSSAYLARMKGLQAGMKAQNGHTYLNNYYDDMEWQALACLRAFELTGDASYKATADLLWTDIKTGWNDEQGGGIAWQKKQLGFKNTPANAPAAILAARLYELNHYPADLAWARKIYAYVRQTLVDPTSGAVWDGINGRGDGQLDKKQYTYNQGVYLGAGLALYRATRQAAYLADANRTAAYVLRSEQLAPGGILKNENGGDGGLFKGILVRYLTLLATEPAVSAANRASYAAFLKANGESLTQRATQHPQYLFNSDWTTLPGPTVDASTELSGVMLLEALADLQARQAL